MNDKSFVDIDCGELELVINELTKSELKIWLYLTKNKQRSISTSCGTAAFLSGKLNVSEPTIKRAIARLKELNLGYLLDNWN
jgi:DNA-binding MurR/RpiR family transcriptional regulator